MKHLRLVGWVACAGLIAGCESTDTTGTAEQRALARQRAAQANAAQYTPRDEAQQNLYNAQHNVIHRDGSVLAGY
jgi:hypothetical protein